MEFDKLGLKKEFIPEIEKAYDYLIGYLNENDRNELVDIVLVTMTKNLIERVKTIQLLSESNREESISILTRAFLELNVSIRFILLEDTEKLATSYFYNQKIQSMKKLLAMPKTDPSYNLSLTESELKVLRKELPEASSLEDYVGYYEKKWSELFSSPPFQRKGKKKKYYKKWYSLNWKYNNFKDMMLAVGMNEPLYHFFYGLTSVDVHAMGAIGNLEINDSTFKLNGTLPTYLCYLAIETYLSTVIYELSKYYDLIQDTEQVENFRRIANACNFLK